MPPPSFEELQAQANAPISEQAKSVVGQLAPFATTLTTGNDMGMLAAQHIAPPPAQGVIGTLFGKLESFGSEALHLTGSAIGWVGKELYSAADSVIHTPVNAYHFAQDAWDSHQQGNQANELISKQQALSAAWRSGQMSDKQFSEELKPLMDAQSKLSDQIATTYQKIGRDGGALENSVVNTTAAIITVMTGGLTAPLEGIGIKSATEAADYLQSAGTRALLSPGEEVITKAASDSSFMKSLPATLQTAVKDSVYRVLVGGTPDLAPAAAARAAAANFALKYPLGYAAISGTGQQIYKDLQDGKYGNAIASLAFNALLLFSGGPIGWALKRGGQAVKNISVAAGLRPGSVLDELSSYIGNGERTELSKVARTRLAAGKTDEVKAVIVAMDSNLAKAKGNIGQAAAQIAEWWNYRGHDLSTWSHEQAWNDLVNYWQSALDLEAEKSAGLIEGIAKDDPRPVVPGAWSTEDKVKIADMGWDAYKETYPNAAAVNNANIAQQIQKIEDTITNPTERKNAIMSIPTQFGLEGLRKEVADKFASRGYIAIIPQSHDLPIVPFEEGSKSLATQGAESEFFVRAGGPVPVLSYIGNMLVRAGLSPEMSTLRTYQLFRDEYIKTMDQQVLKDYGAKLEAARAAKAASTTVSEINKAKDAWAQTGLSEADIAYAKKFKYTPEEAVRKFGGGSGNIEQRTVTEAEIATDKPTTPQSTADYMLKKLKAYMANPTHGGIMMGSTRVRPPITDIRQLTTKDIMAALNVDKGTAQTVAESIMQAHLNLPREVIGLGERMMDYNYKYNPLAAPYARYQGAGRFTWDPFFRHMRLPFKAEFLSQATANGKFLTIPGTNWLGKALFANRYKEFDQIVASLKEGKLLPGGLGGEAAASEGPELVKLGEHYPKAALYPVASLVADMARRAQMDSATFISKFPQEVSDAATAILHYDRNNSFLNSPLVKTLNFAFFPARFNVKVATIMAKTLSQQDPLIQFAVIKGIMNADTFFTSPQGQAWYSQNADIIGFFKYISPLETLSQVAQIMGSKGGRISAYGELGGLPFGWIPALTDAMGITDFQQPYVNPTTGKEMANYIPVTARGHVEAAIEDLISNLFSYPGTQMGLPSKTSISVKIAQGATGGTSQDFNKVTPPLSPEQERFQATVQQLHGATPEGIPNNIGSVPPDPTTIQPLASFNAPPRPITAHSSPAYNKDLRRNRVSTAFEGQPPLP